MDASEAYGLNMMLMLESTEDPVAASLFFERLTRQQYVDGVVLASHDINDALIARLLDSTYPFVLVGRDLHNHGHFVDVDNRGAAKLATRHLIEHGRRKITTFTGPPHLLTAKDRLDGYLDAMQEAGLKPFPKEPICGFFSQFDTLDLALKLLAGPERPDAIFAADDAMAIGVMQAAARLGIHIPDDLAIVGFDDVRINQAYQIELTTISQPTEEMGHRAMSVLAAMIPGQPETPVQHWMESPLIRRGSCGCPPVYVDTALPGKEGASFAAAVTNVMVQTL